ncbi:MAG: M23 family metallopeptidase [Methanosarcina sp.]
MLLLKYLIYSILFINTLYNTPKDTPKDRSIFIPPVTIPVLLSSNFGELRIDHFHSGIDIKTQGETGKDVVAAADGYISRISVSPGGFGNALYVKHPSGYSTVYAHLDRFTPEIESYVRAQQYEKQSFLVTLFPAKEKFPVTKGQLIAYSGNSGSSGGPHLHYEIRESDSEKPLNPLLFVTGASDNIAPVIEKIVIYPLSLNSLVNNHRNNLKIAVKPVQGKYTLLSDKELVLSGNAGFGIKVYDLLNGSPNKCAAYSIELKIDSNTIYKYTMDGFPFTESRYVNAHIDYETFMKDNTYIERAFVLPNDKLENYSNLVNRGIFNFKDDKKHTVKFIVSDIMGNKSTLAFQVRSTIEKPKDPSSPEASNRKMMPYEKGNKFSAEDISINIPSGALYDTLWFSYRKNPGTPVMLSDLHSVHNKLTPLQKAYTIAIKPTKIPGGLESKMLIVQLNDNMSKRACPSTWSDGYVKADVMNFGDYYVGIDTTAPNISATGISGANLTGKKEIRIRISDNFSGIKAYEPVIDGKWALFEYDPKNSVLIYKFDPKYISKGKNHSLALKVTDNVNNESNYNVTFIW